MFEFSILDLAVFFPVAYWMGFYPGEKGRMKEYVMGLGYWGQLMFVMYAICLLWGLVVLMKYFLWVLNLMA